MAPSQKYNLGEFGVKWVSSVGQGSKRQAEIELPMLKFETKVFIEANSR